MKIFFIEARDDLTYWVVDPRGNKETQRTDQLIKSSPFKGIGKPGPLRHQVEDYWSRRIDHEHRLVYDSWEEKNRSGLYYCSVWILL